MNKLAGVTEDHERMMKRVEGYASSLLERDNSPLDPEEVYIWFVTEGHFTPRDVMEAMDHLGLLPEEVQMNYRISFPERIWE